MSTRKGQYLSLLNSHHEKLRAFPREGIKYRRLRCILLYLLLSSVAVIISTTLSFSPWSLLPSSILYRVKETFDPASEWDDNIWPIRQQTPWDISTNFDYPRTLTYDVQEGTWLRLDVHQISGDIVFDMIGDLYCLPGRLALQLRDGDAPIKALPILTGIPFDSDPHFSPNGDRLVFRSDAELGVENIWAMEWTGCETMELKMRVPSDLQPPEETQKKRNRLAYEGRLTGTLEYHLSSWSLKSAR